MTAPGPEHRPNLVADLKRVAAIAAKVGGVLAVICHMLPVHYRPICDQLAALCGAGS